MENTKIKIIEPKTQTKIGIEILLLKSIEEEQLINECIINNCKVYHSRTTKEALEEYKIRKFPVIITALGLNKDESDSWEPIVSTVRSSDSTAFIIIFSHTASKNPIIRVNCFESGCNMVTSCLKSLSSVLNKIVKIINQPGKLTCPLCGFKSLTEDGLWVHLPLYHINHDPKLTKQIKKCPICLKLPSPNLQVHYRNFHGPCGRGELKNEENEPVTLYSFALVVVHRKKDNKYLLIQEFAKSGFWLPGGRVDPFEDLQTAAIRETKEEGGIDIRLTGILTFQFNHGHGRLRIIFYGEPIDEDQLPKTIPDYESVGACYVNYDEIAKLPLRGDEPTIWISYVEQGKMIFPLSLMTNE